MDARRLCTCRDEIEFFEILNPVENPRKIDKHFFPLSLKALTQSLTYIFRYYQANTSPAALLPLPQCEISKYDSQGGAPPLGRGARQLFRETSRMMTSQVCKCQWNWFTVSDLASFFFPFFLPSRKSSSSFAVPAASVLNVTVRHTYLDSARGFAARKSSAVVCTYLCKQRKGKVRTRSENNGLFFLGLPISDSTLTLSQAPVLG